MKKITMIQNRTMGISFFILIILSLFSCVGNAEINLTIYSENELSANIISLSSTNNFTINNSETKNLTYDNYVINVYPDYKTLSNQTVMNNINIFVNDRYRFIGISLLFMIVIIGYIVIKKVGKWIK